MVSAKPNRKRNGKDEGGVRGLLNCRGIWSKKRRFRFISLQCHRRGTREARTPHSVLKGRRETFRKRTKEKGRSMGMPSLREDGKGKE